MEGVNRPASVRSQERTGTRRYSDLQGIGRALAILEALAERPMRAKEVADALGLKWTTAYRALAHLREGGYLRRDDTTGLYSVGTRLYAIGASYLANLAIVQLGRPYLRAAADEAAATAQLVERDRDRAVVLAVAEPPSETIPKSTAGFHFPLHAGSKGRVLLAFSDEETIRWYLGRPLEQLTRHTITDPVELRLILARIREQGYAATLRDVQLSTGSVAAPVHDASGAVVACVCLIASAADVEEREARLADVALATARSLSVALGWRPVRGRVE